MAAQAVSGIMGVLGKTSDLRSMSRSRKALVVGGVRPVKYRILGSNSSRQVFLSSISGSGSRWQVWQKLCAAIRPTTWVGSAALPETGGAGSPDASGPAAATSRQAGAIATRPISANCRSEIILATNTKRQASVWARTKTAQDSAEENGLATFS